MLWFAFSNPVPLELCWPLGSIGLVAAAVIVTAVLAGLLCIKAIARPVKGRPIAYEGGRGELKFKPA